MRSVLGIDAAWTATQPSGIALVAETKTGWCLRAVEASYEHFHARADCRVPREDRCLGLSPDAKALLASSRALCGSDVDVVAVDMPLAYEPITKRRASDDDVSRAYGARKCSTHTPSATRPGKISDDLTSGFRECGFHLRTCRVSPHSLIEVYPHPALVMLSGAAERLTYKVAKVRRYWPTATPDERREKLFVVWAEIVKLLDNEIAGVAAAMPAPAIKASGMEMKGYEDKLDAVVCAWVAICALEGRAKPFGDATSAIWIPTAVLSVNHQPSRSVYDGNGMNAVWDGGDRAEGMEADHFKNRQCLADAAEAYDWAKVLSIVEADEELINTTRPGGVSLSAPLHLAAQGGASAEVTARLIEMGAWRTLRNSDGERPVAVAERMGHQHLLELLTPHMKRHIPTNVLRRIRTEFHAVIRNRAKQQVREFGLRLPELEPLLEFKNPKFWFAVPGMFGGFSYWFREFGVEAVLVSESWCRVVGGSGERHEITSAGSRLVDEGFV